MCIKTDTDATGTVVEGNMKLDDLFGAFLERSLSERKKNAYDLIVSLSFSAVFIFVLRLRTNYYYYLILLLSVNVDGLIIIIVIALAAIPLHPQTSKIQKMLWRERERETIVFIYFIVFSQS